MATEHDLEVIAQWHKALNHGDVATLVALVQPDVEIGGPRGTAHGAEIVAAWFGRANVQMHPHTWYQRDNTIIVEARAEWRDADSGAVTTVANIATRFRMANGHIAAIHRHDDPTQAFNSGDITHADQVQPPQEVQSWHKQRF